MSEDKHTENNILNLDSNAVVVIQDTISRQNNPYLRTNSYQEPEWMTKVTNVDLKITEIVNNKMTGNQSSTASSPSSGSFGIQSNITGSSDLYLDNPLLSTFIEQYEESAAKLSIPDTAFAMANAVIGTDALSLLNRQQKLIQTLSNEYKSRAIDGMTTHLKYAKDSLNNTMMLAGNNIKIDQ